MKQEDAEEYTQALGQVVAGGWRQIALGKRLGVPKALGLSVNEWVEKRLGGYIRLSLDERKEAVRELAAEGESDKGISDITGVHRDTVRKWREDEDAQLGTLESNDDTPEQVRGSRNDGGAQLGSPEPLNALGALVVGEMREKERRKAAAPPLVDGDEWYTPRWLFDGLGIKFSIDVCAPLDQTYSSVPAELHFTIENDGLAQTWDGTVWCNPPYSQPEPWARRMIHHGNGLLLSHVPINAAWSHDVWEACDAIRLFQAMEFVRPDGTSQRPGYWLQLAAFGPVATEGLARLQPLGDAAFNKRRVASPMWKRVP